MTDDLDRLTRALRDTPPPDAQARARALALAMESFDRLQGTAAAARPTQGSPHRAGVLRKAKAMFDRLTTRQMLAGTASAAVMVVALVAVMPQMRIIPPIAAPQAVDQPALSRPVAEARVPPAADSAEATVPAAPAPVAEPPPPAAPASTVADAAPAPAEASLAEAPVAEAPAADSSLAEAAPPPPAPRAVARTRQPAGGMALSQAAPMDGAVMQRPAESFAPDLAPPPLPDTEAFANADPNPVKVTAEAPVSTFSVDVDTASYAVVRQSLMAGQIPPRDAVRVEEMLNYFPYAYPAPTGDRPFSTTVSVFPTPWNPGTRLVRIGLQGRMPATADRPPLNLVFLIDTSGSMEDAAKLPLLRQSLALMLGDLRPVDQVAIVTYAGSAGLVLPPTPGTDTAAITGALDRLDAGGSTAGAEGLALAYQVAEGMAADGEVSRVVLATDGDFNVGISDPAALTDFVAERRADGTYLSVLGFGRGNLDDATMQALAQNGNGTAAYIDTLGEARKVLVDQLTGALFPIADDVKVQVEWNPAQVAEYRLIGYETRALAREDFNDDRVDAGEIGAGLQVTALYEIAAPGSSGLRNDPLRYGAAVASGDSPELGFLRLRWKAPGATDSQLSETAILPTDAPPDDDARFAAAIAGFGQLLRGDGGTGDWGYADAAALAEGARGADPFGYRIEAVNLMRLAQALTR